MSKTANAKEAIWSEVLEIMVIFLYAYQWEVCNIYGI